MNMFNLETAKTLPLQLVQVVPLVLQVFAIIELTNYLLLQNRRKVVNEVFSQSRQEMSDRIRVNW